jgi:DNA-3-methyladenine glycosylase II
VYCVFMQRTPITQAAALKRRFLAAFGKPVLAGDHELRAMPEMHELGALTAGEIAQAIGHARKAELVVSVVRGVAALGEEFLATAPYAAARDGLLAIAGVGPFSAGAILLRGLGRMDELPGLEMIAGDAARSVYGPRFDPDAIVARYGRTIGYWSFYLKAGAARLTSSNRATPATRAHGRHTPGSRQSARTPHQNTVPRKALPQVHSET